MNLIVPLCLHVNLKLDFVFCIGLHSFLIFFNFFLFFSIIWKEDQLVIAFVAIVVVIVVATSLGAGIAIPSTQSSIVLVFVTMAC